MTSYPQTLVRRPTIIVIAGNAWSGMASSERHLARELARVADVLYVDPPRLTWPSVRRPSSSEVAPGVLRMTPSVPRGAYRWPMRAVTAWLCALQVRAELRRLRRSPHSVLAATYLPVLAHLQASRRVLYATDDWVAGADLMRVPDRWVARVVRRQARRANHIVAVSDQLRQWYVVAAPTPVTVVPNGCDARGLSAVDTLPEPPGIELASPRAGFVGNLSDRVDLDVLEAVVDSGVPLLLVGPRRDRFGGDRFERLVERENVQWVGEQPADAIPQYLRSIDVGITPYRRNDFNDASSPLKTIEYLAAGRASVATELRSVVEAGLPEVATAGSPAEFAAAVRTALATPRTADVAAARRSAAERHSWAHRVVQMLPLLGLETLGR